MMDHWPTPFPRLYYPLPSTAVGLLCVCVCVCRCVANVWTVISRLFAADLQFTAGNTILQPCLIDCRPAGSTCQHSVSLPCPNRAPSLCVSPRAHAHVSTTCVKLQPTGSGVLYRLLTRQIKSRDGEDGRCRDGPVLKNHFMVSTISHYKIQRESYAATCKIWQTIESASKPKV